MSVKSNNTQPVPKANRARNDDYVVWDDALPQLGRRIRNARETWIIQTRVGGKTQRRTLGACGGIKVQTARLLAQACLEELAEPELSVSGNTTVKNFAARFLEDCKGQWKPATLKSHRHGIKKLMLPFFGTRKVSSINRGDVLDWQRSLTYSAGTRNRALAVLSSMMRHAELIGLRPPGTNPCAGLRRHKSDFKAEYLDAAGYRALAGFLEEEAEKNPTEVAMIRFLALTGCRRGEAEQLTWAMIDKNRAALPDAKSGPRAIWLGKPVIKLLAGLPRTGEYVFSDMGSSAQRLKVSKLWNRVRVQMNKPKLRLHDLRHSFASVAVNAGLDLRVIGGLLGHVDPGTTAGYAHLDKARVAAASQRVGKHLDAALAPDKKRRKANKNIYEIYLDSRQRLKIFCILNKLDPQDFQKDLATWRKSQNMRRAAK